MAAVLSPYLATSLSNHSFSRELCRISILILNAAPLLSRALSVAVVVEVVERVVEWVGLGGTDNADDLSVGVALDTRLGDDGVLDAGDGKRIVGVCAGCGCAELLLYTTGGSLETGYETETTVVLRHGLFLVPSICVSYASSSIAGFGCSLE
ncbi:hypothetical protein HG530_008890 [Fusarium avenaceum]|nr:hypothetical protein HG530_008890 [Fusarium avenaceum]